MRLEVQGLLVISATALLFAANPTAHSSTFEKTAQPMLAKTCAPCHNDRLASGGLNLGFFSTASSIAEHRDGWERILQKLRSGEMPPKGIPRPPDAEIAALVKYVHGEFERADRSIKADP